MALYRFVVDNNEWALKEDYPKIHKTVTHSRNTCLLDDNGQPIIGTYTPEATSPTTPGLYIATKYTRCLTTQTQTQGSQFSFTQGSDSTSSMVPDPYYLRGPTCVLCASPKGLIVNWRLKGAWLHWRALPGASGARQDTYKVGDVPLGRFGHYELFVDPGQQSKFPEFVMFVLAASTQSDTSSAGSGGAGGGNGSAQAKQALQGLGILPGNCIIDGANIITCP